MTKPVILMILDGWGNAPASPDNAISIANTKNWDQLSKQYPQSKIHTSGQYVGLPDGQMGNSEVGHMNIGAGRVIYQSLSRIQKDLSEHQFEQTKILTGTCENAKNNALHIMGLASPGGVHSHQDHILAIIKLAMNKGVKNIYLHAFLDGRDVAPQSAKSSIKQFQALENEQFKIKTVIGRYYAMDRDNHWDRIESAFSAIAFSKAKFQENNAITAIENAYIRGETDEFIQPTIIGHKVSINNGDSIIFANFRADRARQLTNYFIGDQFKSVQRPNLKAFVTMTEYQKDLHSKVVYPPNIIHNSLGEVLANNEKRQLRLAETEKYAHVTYFFNGGEEKIFNLEDRILVPSPGVATYDLQPEMSAAKVTKELVTAIQSEKYDFICINYANPDMVGHTGNLEASLQAVETIDQILGQITEITLEKEIYLLITADHGNIEQMVNPETGNPMTSHTKNTVPLLLVHPDQTNLKPEGALCDLAPTILKLLDLKIPTEMTGKPLL